MDVNQKISRSQNGEDLVIQRYFTGRDPRTLNILDIGANDGVTLSNSRLAVLNGWNACLVEPSPKAFSKLKELYDHHHAVTILPYAVSFEEGKQTFYESGKHLGDNDVALLSTLDEKELDRWEGSENEFTEVEVDVVSFSTLLGMCPCSEFQCISIDAEGLDFEILQQIDLLAVKCEMLIIEYNTDEVLETKIRNHMTALGFMVVEKNAENLIFWRN